MDRTKQNDEIENILNLNDFNEKNKTLEWAIFYFFFLFWIEMSELKTYISKRIWFVILALLLFLLYYNFHHDFVYIFKICNF